MNRLTTERIRPGSLICGAMTALVAVSAQGQIVGSAHDFSGAGWSQTQTCLPCHTTLNSDTVEINGFAAGRLWNHALPSESQVYTTYNGDYTRNDALDSYSILCMGCHDGTVAIDSFGGNTGTRFLLGNAVVGTDLTKTHPVGVSAVWPEHQPEYFNPRSTWENRTFGSSRMGRLRQMLVNGEAKPVVSCATCHEPHGRGGHDNMLRIDNTSSQMCLICHAK